MKCWTWLGVLLLALNSTSALAHVCKKKSPRHFNKSTCECSCSYSSLNNTALALSNGNNTELNAPSVSSIPKSNTPTVVASIPQQTSPKDLECSEITRSDGANTLICMRSNSAPISYPTVIISLIALFLSIGSIIYTWRKDKRARTQSIEDDYWLRKVLTPQTIEPLMELVAELTSSLPNDCASPTSATEDYRTFAQDWQSKISKLHPSIKVLSILHGDLCKRVLIDIQNIEDELLEYCGTNAQLSKQSSGAATKSRTDTQERINSLLISILSEIKNFQAKSGVNK